MIRIPDTVTETLRAYQITPGRVIFLPMTVIRETVTAVEHRNGYVIVRTVEGSEFHWPGSDKVRALT